MSTRAILYILDEGEEVVDPATADLDIPSLLTSHYKRRVNKQVFVISLFLFTFPISLLSLFKLSTFFSRFWEEK